MKDKIIEAHYLPLFKKYGPSQKVLDWESKEAQQIRFSILISEINLKGLSLLDVGCGTGDLYAYLQEKKINCHYTGIDALSQMVKAAKEKYPQADFFQYNITEGNNINKKILSNIPHPDCIFASGIFNLGTNLQEIIHTIQNLLKLSPHWIVFNLLDENSPDKEAPYCYYNKQQVLDKLKEKFKDLQIRLRSDYLANDFTLILTKEK